jgi:hypothetical protein
MKGDAKRQPFGPQNPWIAARLAAALGAASAKAGRNVSTDSGLPFKSSTNSQRVESILAGN